MERRRVSLNEGDSLVVETPLGVVRVEAGARESRYGDSPTDVIDIQPKPTDHRLDGRVLLANVQDQKHTVRLIALPGALVDAREMPSLVASERADLVRRVLSAVTKLTGGGEGSGFGESFAHEVAAEVLW